MNGISNNPILLLFCVIFCCCVYAYTFWDPMLSHHVCISLLIHSISIIMSQLLRFLWAYTYSYKYIKSILYPLSLSFLNIKNLFLLEKLLKKWKYFFTIHEEIGVWDMQSCWNQILVRGFDAFSTVFSSLKNMSNTWSHLEKFFLKFSLIFDF